MSYTDHDRATTGEQENTTILHVPENTMIIFCFVFVLSQNVNIENVKKSGFILGLCFYKYKLFLMNRYDDLSIKII